MNERGLLSWSFNPAEAEDGFRSNKNCLSFHCFHVSIQPKPKTGLEGYRLNVRYAQFDVSIQPKPKTGLEEFSYSQKVICRKAFQSSRSRRRV